MSEPRQTTWVAGENTGLDDERSIREGETAVERYHNSRDEARAQIMPMARGLLAAKRKYPATQEFGNWLDTSRYARLEKDDRAALIKIGEHEEFALKFIRTTSLISPETIWDAIKERLPTSDDPTARTGTTCFDWRISSTFSSTSGIATAATTAAGSGTSGSIWPRKLPVSRW